MLCNFFNLLGSTNLPLFNIVLRFYFLVGFDQHLLIYTDASLYYTTTRLTKFYLSIVV